MDALIKPCEVLLLLSVLSLPALEAQTLHVQPKVTGYIQDEVTLSCKFIQGSKQANITAVQWDLISKEAKGKGTIIVFNVKYGLFEHNSTLKGRVRILNESLIIHNVKMSDAGTYKCHVTTYPHGAFEEMIQLEVKEPVKPWLVAVIVVVVLLLFIILAATVYLVFIRRFLFRQRGLQQVHVTTAAPLNHDVVYADVHRKPAGRPPPSRLAAADVTYSEVALRGQQHTWEEEEEEMDI